MYVCVCVSVCVRVRLPRDVRGLAHGVDPAVDPTWAIVDSGNYGPKEARGHTWIKFDWDQNIDYEHFSVTASGVAMRKHTLTANCLRCCCDASGVSLSQPNACCANLTQSAPK